jgi:hypothetical protein
VEAPEGTPVSYCPAKYTGGCPAYGMGATEIDYNAIATNAAAYSMAPYFVIGVTRTGAVVERNFTDKGEASDFFDEVAGKSGLTSVSPKPQLLHKDLGYVALFYKAEADDYGEYGFADERKFGAGGTTAFWNVQAKLPWFIAAAAVVGVAFYYGKPRFGAAKRRRRRR